MSNPLHFTSGNYTVIKNRLGQYCFAGLGKYEAMQHFNRLHIEIQRRQREIEALTSFLNGESQEDPEALSYKSLR